MPGLDVLAAAVLRGAVAGLATGLFALGLVVTYRVTGVLNLALGGVASVTAFVLWGAWADGPVPLVPALVLALAVAALLGLVGHVVLLRLDRSSTAVKMVATLGLLLVAQGAIALVWGPGERLLPLLVDGGVGRGTLRLGYQQLLGAGVAAATGLALAWWARNRPTGTAALALGEDRAAARLLGLPTRRVAAGAWVVAAVLAGMAGVLLSGLTVLNGSEMTLAMMSGLAAALLAGFDRLSVAVTGSAAVGAMTAVAGSLDAVASVPGLVESVALILVVVLVVARPSAALEGAGVRT